MSTITEVITRSTATTTTASSTTDMSSTTTNSAMMMERLYWKDYTIVNCVGVPDYDAVNIPISSSQEDVLLALDHGVGVRIHDHLEVQGALGLYGPWELHGGWDEALIRACRGTFSWQ